MNNNAAAILRALIVYAICAPLAIWVGCLLTSVADFSSRDSFVYAGIFVLVLCIPILLRWHHILLVFCWSLPLSVFFLPGRPDVYMPVIVLSLGISIIQRTTNKNMRFIPAPQITWPLLFMLAVVLFTAKMTGGIGLRSMGSEVMGGKKYVTLLIGIVGYFALTARRIPPQQAGLYVALFFLGGCASVIGDMASILPSAFYFIFLFFPPNGYAFGGGEDAYVRLAGLCTASMAIFSFMLVRYGIRGVFLEGKWWRSAVLILSFMGVFFGGFRSFVGLCVLIFLIQFFLEGLHRTKLLPLFMFMGVFATVLCIPFSDHLPNSVQRALSFLPLKINPVVKADAEASLDWRIEMWEAVLPQVPGHLLLGKGYAISQEDFEAMGHDSAFHAIDPAEQGLALAGDYHNGPLSVILPFGIWGVIAFLWFLIAGGWALHRNFRHGDPALQTINTALFALFIAQIIFFFLVFGAFANDVLLFGGYFGLSVSLNGGIRRPSPAPAAKKIEPKTVVSFRPQFEPVFPR